MKNFRFAPLFFALVTTILSGCHSVPANKPAVTYILPPPTALVITVESAAMTEEEYQARRSELINYLIERGYIQSEGDLVAEEAGARRLIRATLGADGGFKISVFNFESEAVADPAVVVAAEIPAYYYDDYYYYGFAPVPFYGYASWPAYYPIYPSYPLCPPPSYPHVPYCAPAAPSHHSNYRPPLQYANCSYHPAPHNQWTSHQSWSAWSHSNWHYSRSNGSSGPVGTQFAGSARTSPASASARSAGSTGDHRPPYSHSRERNGARSTATTVAHDDSTVPPSTQATATPNSGNSERSRRPHGRTTAPTNVQPTTPEQAQASTTSAAPSGAPRYAPPRTRVAGNDNSGANPAPRTSAPESRPAGTATRQNGPDGHSRAAAPTRGNDSARQTNVATTARSAPAPRGDSAPRSNPAPRQDSSSSSRSAPSTSNSSSSSSSHAATNGHDGASSRANER
ncbi:MAG TPA: hypothetical protein VFJ90_02180 [Candidatus Didemnitutus sp.]|nr:hypothetical protein [Candidatus Didemnitutus sp.]